jgi:hypothetical protein
MGRGTTTDFTLALPLKEARNSAATIVFRVLGQRHFIVVALAIQSPPR